MFAILAQRNVFIPQDQENRKHEHLSCSNESNVRQIHNSQSPTPLLLNVPLVPRGETISAPRSLPFAEAWLQSFANVELVQDAQ